MRARVGEVELEYSVRGEGPPLVLSHGIGGSGADFDPIVPALARRYRVITYDVRGFGASDRPPAGYSVETFARDLAGLLDSLGLERAAVLGTSMGGVITQRFLLDYPERATAAIICSSSSEVNERARAAWFAQAEAIEREGMGGWLRRSRPPEQAGAPLTEQEEQRVRNNPDSGVYAQVVRAVADYNYTSALEGVRTPTLVLVGDADRQTPPGGSVIISRRIPGAELHILPGLGHNLSREAPEQVVTLVSDFLDRVLPARA